jgi:EAL domain-containing protein (putative c-di-GMP-specific phosphodiesterase class I)
MIGSVLKRGDRDVCSSADANIVPVAEKLDHRVLELVVAELAASPNVQLRLNISPDTTMDPDWWASIELLLHGHSGCPNG